MKQSYNPSIFIQRVESVGANATKEIVVNTVENMEVAQSISILDVDYLIEKIDSATKIVTLDKNRDSNINLALHPVIEVLQNVADTNGAINPPIPITATERHEKLLSISKEFYTAKLNKAQQILGIDYYGMKASLDSEIRAYLGTFNVDNVPILYMLSQATNKSIKEVAMDFKEKLVEFNRAKQILDVHYTNLVIKIKDANSKQELDSISFTTK